MLESLPDLAAHAAQALAPWLPVLMKTAGEKAAEKVGEEAPGAVVALWKRLREHLWGKEAAKEAAEDLAEKKDDPNRQAAFVRQLEKLLEGSPQLTADVRALVQNTRTTTVSYSGTVSGSGALAQGARSVAAGQGGIAIGGHASITGGIHTGSDKPKS